MAVRPSTRPAALHRQDVADAFIFVFLLAIVGAVIGLYAFALFSALDGDWVRAVIAAGIASVPAAGLALYWLKA